MDRIRSDQVEIWVSLDQIHINCWCTAGCRDAGADSEIGPPGDMTCNKVLIGGYSDGNPPTLKSELLFNR